MEIACTVLRGEGAGNGPDLPGVFNRNRDVILIVINMRNRIVEYWCFVNNNSCPAEEIKRPTEGTSKEKKR